MKKMYNLKQLLEIGDYSSVTTKQTSVNPETGKITWDVSYKPNFTEILKKLNEVIKNIQDAQKDEHMNDADINNGVKALKAAKKTIETAMQEKYPQYL